LISPVPTGEIKLLDGTKVETQLSSNALLRPAQRAYQGYLTDHPKSWLALGRVSRELYNRRRFEENVGAGQQAGLVAAGKALRDPLRKSVPRLKGRGQLARERAVKAVAEGDTLQGLIDFATQGAKNATTRAELTGHLADLRLFKSMGAYITDVGGKAVFRSDLNPALLRKLRQGYVSLGKAAKDREANFRAAGVELGSTGRESMPGRVTRGEVVHPGPRAVPNAASGLPPVEAGQLSLAGSPKARTIYRPASFQGGAFRVATAPTGLRQRAAAAVRGARAGMPQKPQSVTHGYEGKLRLAGNESPRVFEAQAASLGESQNFRLKNWLREQVLPMGETFSKETLPTDARKNYQPVRLNAKVHLPADVKGAIDKREAGLQLTKVEENAIKSYDVGQDIFPDINTLKSAEDYKGVVFVPKRVFTHVAPKTAVREGFGADVAHYAMWPVRATNQITRAAILFVGPKYIVMNLPQNYIMTAVQQGPLRAAENYRLAMRAIPKTLGPDLYAYEKSILGEGAMVSGLGGKGQILGRMTGTVAQQFSRPTDTPFRISAHFYEVQRETGIRSVAEFKAILKKARADDPAAKQLVYRTLQRAQNAVGDYQRMGPIEKIARDIIFFYPWIKVATRWTKHTVAEHPIQLGMGAQLARRQEEQITKELGPQPNYLQGLVKGGQRGKYPMVYNTTNLGILNTPVQGIQAIGATLSGDPNAADTVVGNFTPALGFLSSLISRKNSFGQDYPAGTSAMGIAKDQFYNSIPAIRMVNRLQGQSPSKLYPMNRADIIKQGVFGSWFKKPLDAAYGNQIAEDTRTSSMGRVQKAQAANDAETRLFRTAGVVSKAGPLPPRLAGDLKGRALYRLALAKAREDAGPEDLAKGALTPYAKLTVAVNLLAQHGKLTDSDATKHLATFQKATPERIVKLLAWIDRTYFDSQYVASMAKGMRNRGYHLDSVNVR